MPDRPPLLSKLPQVGTTIFTVMSALAREHGAINLSQGFPDFDPPAALKQALADAATSDQHQYPPMTGLPELRAAVAAKVKGLYGRSVNTDDEVTIVPGATEGIFCAVQALVRQGDEVILLDPCYDSYAPSVILAGGRPVHVPLALPNYRVDWDRVRDAVTKRTALIMINSPHNPTATVWSADDLAALADITRGTRIHIVSDEVYEHLVFDGATHQSVLTRDDLYDRSIAVFSFGKTFHVTGWKTGYCIAPERLTSEMRKVHQFVTFVGVTPVQRALATFMEANPQFPLTLAAFYTAKRDLFVDALKDSRFRLLPSAGSFFQLADYSDLSDLGDVDFARRMTIEHGVAVIPISVFYADPPDARIIRFCFAKEDATLLQAADKLTAL